MTITQTVMRTLEQENSQELGRASRLEDRLTRCIGGCRERGIKHCWTIGFVGCCIASDVAYVLHLKPFGFD